MVGELKLSCGLFSVQRAGTRDFLFNCEVEIFLEIYVSPDEDFSQKPISSLIK